MTKATREPRRLETGDWVRLRGDDPSIRGVGQLIDADFAREDGALTACQVEVGARTHWAARSDGHAWPLPPPGIRRGAADGDYVNEKDGSVLVFVPPGDYHLAALLSSPQFSRPNVTLTRGFFIGKTELSRGRWERFRRETGRTPLPWEGEQDEDLPATHVSRDDARAYCEWAGLRLPSDAEWEAAARGPAGHLFPWGDTLVPGATNSRGPHDGLSPCGRMPRDCSPFGCMDMAGNVHEWVDDRHDALVGHHYTDRRGDRDKPGAPRGGAWNLGEEDCRATVRIASGIDPGAVGFRVARDLR